MCDAFDESDLDIDDYQERERLDKINRIKLMNRIMPVRDCSFDILIKGFDTDQIFLLSKVIENAFMAGTEKMREVFLNGTYDFRDRIKNEGIEFFKEIEKL